MFNLKFEAFSVSDASSSKEIMPSGGEMIFNVLGYLFFYCESGSNFFGGCFISVLFIKKLIGFRIFKR